MNNAAGALWRPVCCDLILHSNSLIPLKIYIVMQMRYRMGVAATVVKLGIRSTSAERCPLNLRP